MHRQAGPSPMLRPWVPYSVLAVGLLVTLAGVMFIARTAHNRDLAAFEAITDDTQRLLDVRLKTDIALLRAGAAFVAGHPGMTADDFQAFVRAVRTDERDPGLQDIAFTPADAAADPNRRAAMERSRDTGEPAVSARLLDGLALYAPVFAGAPADSVEARRAALVGYVQARLRLQDLFDDELPGRSDLSARIYDGDRAQPERLLHQHHAPEPDPEFARTTHLTVAGRPWTLVFESAAVVGGRSPLLVPGVGVGGVLLSLALFSVMQSQRRTWAATRQLADEVQASEEALRESSERLRRLVVLEREARADAQQADRAKDDFLATLSHELRTPLNAMLGWIAMLRAGRVRAERQADALEVIERNARMQAKLIEDLLDVSRIIAGKIRLEPQQVALGPIVASVVDALRPAAEQKGVRLTTSLEERLPSIAGDAARLQQIVANLLSNAIKFTPSGGHVTVKLWGEDAPLTALVLEVQDTGIGIAPAFLPHVFERFRQADSSTTRAHSGVGLGLAIVSHLVELHGGTIEAHSNGPNTGARFVARFPHAG